VRASEVQWSYPARAGRPRL